MKFRILAATMLSCVVCLTVFGSNSFGQADARPQTAICQRTSGDTNPYVLITVPASSVPEHIAKGAVYPVDGSCPGGSINAGGDPDPGAVPEPLTILLFGSGLAGVGYATRRWQKKGKPDGGHEG